MLQAFGFKLLKVNKLLLLFRFIELKEILVRHSTIQSYERLKRTKQKA